MAWFTRETHSWYGTPRTASPARPRSNSRNATDGNAFASDTVPPAEPPIIAGKRKLADPASTWNDADWSGRKCSMPLEALSFMPTMFGCTASRATSAALRVTPQNPGAL